MMGRSILVGVLAVCGFAAVAGSPEAAMGQFLPHAYGYGPGWGAHPYGAINDNYNKSRAVAASQRSQAQSRAMEQNKAVQSGIRSTLSGQASARTQAIIGGQQAGKDWWFQQQQQQLAQTRAVSRSSGMRLGPEFTPTAEQPAAPTV